MRKNKFFFVGDKISVFKLNPLFETFRGYRIPMKVPTILSYKKLIFIFLKPKMAGPFAKRKRTFYFRTLSVPSCNHDLYEKS